MHYHGLPFWKVFLCSIVARLLRRESAGRPVKTRCGLLRAPHGCIGNAGRDRNHPAISSEKTSCKADPIAAETASVVRARADLNAPLTIENCSSIGLMSGVDGGGTTRAPGSLDGGDHFLGLVRLEMVPDRLYARPCRGRAFGDLEDSRAPVTS
jgi:hypothetical protein